MNEQGSIKILISGANGQLGLAFRQIQKQFPLPVHFSFLSKKKLNLLDPQTVEKALQNVDYCINCAAYTAVDQAEKEPFQAFALNAQAVRHLAKACKQHHTKLIHFSTDYVYDSDQTKPYRENDPVNPRSIYAQSKLRGEEFALAENEQTIIFRISWLFSPFGKNFYNSMLQLGSQRKELGIVDDQIGTPTSALHLAKAVFHVIREIEKGLKNWQGIYNFSQAGTASWYDFAAYIMHLNNLPCRVYPIATEDFPQVAQRPAFSLMDKRKFYKTFGWQPIHWMEAVRVVSLQNASR